MPRLVIKNQIDGWDFTVPFTGTQVSIGANGSNTICLQGEGMAPKHCLIFQGPTGVFNLRSVGTGRVEVDGKPVTRDAEIRDGAVIRFGPYLVVYGSEEPKSRRRREETRVPALEPNASHFEASSGGDTEVGEEEATRGELLEPLAPTLGEEVVGKAGAVGSSAGGGADRRRHPRVAMASINWEMRPSSLFNSLMGSGFPIRVIDLSQTGARVVANVPIDKKQEYSMRLQHARLGTVNLTARIVWHERIEHRTQYGEQMMGVVAGLEFKSPGPKQRDAVGDLMDKKNKTKESQKVKYR